MLKASTAKDWERFGEEDPYYGVLSADRFRRGNLDDVGKNAFFASGEEHVARCLSVAESAFGYVPGGAALDFGCGVGRLTNALASRFEHVTGLDISPSMLAEARTQSAAMGIANVDYRVSTDESAFARGKFDFVHSYIVFQHMPVREGEAALTKLVSCLREGGIGAIHLTYEDADKSAKGFFKRLAKDFLPLRYAANIATGRKWNTPSMQMNCYDLPKILGLLAQSGIEIMHVHRVDDFGNLGVFVFFQKAAVATSPWSNPKLPVA